MIWPLLWTMLFIYGLHTNNFWLCMTTGASLALEFER